MFDRISITGRWRDGLPACFGDLIFHGWENNPGGDALVMKR
jgi:hypothetical protein